MKLAIAMLTLTIVTTPAAAQHHHQRQHHQGATPYSGLQQREIKALSEQQIADLRQGRGMGLALAAELNGYPGPMHVLELKEQLRLTDDQHQRFRQLFDSMKAEAIEAGETVIASERALDRQFFTGQMTPQALGEITAQIGAAHGRLRAVHLKYHLTSTELLSHEQRRRYAELRGYR